MIATAVLALALAGVQLPGGSHTGVDTHGNSTSATATPNSQFVTAAIANVLPSTQMTWNPVAGTYVGGGYSIEFWSFQKPDGDTEWFWYLVDASTNQIVATGVVA